VKYIIIDVREPEEYDSGHVDGAINLPPSDLMSSEIKQLKDIPKDAPIILYCRTGSRSNVAMHILQGMGYMNLVNGINKNQVESRYGL
jgi:phage shock protein E